MQTLIPDYANLFRLKFVRRAARLAYRSIENRRRAIEAYSPLPALDLVEERNAKRGSTRNARDDAGNRRYCHSARNVLELIVGEFVAVGVVEPGDDRIAQLIELVDRHVDALRRQEFLRVFGGLLLEKFFGERLILDQFSCLLTTSTS